jgi:nuclear transport factor 2 (NTF2) superfamily protein
MRPPVPPFTDETARQKVEAAEDAWNTRDPERVAAAYTEDSQWRNRSEFFSGHAAIVEFLRRKWDLELDYALRKIDDVPIEEADRRIVGPRPPSEHGVPLPLA